MKSLLAIATVLFISASAVLADDACCSKKAAETCCAKAKGSECSKAKSECPKAAAALRQTLLTHKGAMLAKR